MISAGDEAEFWNRGFCHFLRLLDMAAHAVSGINRWIASIVKSGELDGINHLPIGGTL